MIAMNLVRGQRLRSRLVLEIDHFRLEVRFKFKMNHFSGEGGVLWLGSMVRVPFWIAIDLFNV